MLLDVIFRGIVLKEGAFDLLGIVIIGGLVATVYQTKRKIAGRSMVKAILLSMVAGLLIAVIIAILRR